jgi:malate dehydrogenase
MSVAAVLGAGPRGAAIAHRLAERARFRQIRLIDAASKVAAGKALDIRQSGPIGGFDTRLEGAAGPLDAAGASVIVVADPVEGNGWEGETGLALVRQLVRAGTTAPFVFAAPEHLWLMEKAAAELKVAADRLVGSAASAVREAARALTGIELDGAGADVHVSVTGRPPAFVVGWSSATVAGSLLTDRVPPHRLAAIGQALTRLWPPGPQAVAAATAGIAEGLVFGSRRQHYALTILDDAFGTSTRGVAAMLPLVLGRGRVLQRVVPSLSPQERTELINSLSRRQG